MTKKIIFGLLLLTLVSVALVGSHNLSPSVSSSANLQAYDNKIRLSFDLSSNDKRNFSSIKRSLGFLSSDSDFVLTTSPDTVGTINDLNLAKFKLSTSSNKIDFSTTGQFAGDGVFNSKYIDSGTYLILSGPLPDLSEKLPLTREKIFQSLDNKTLSFTYSDHEPVLVLSGHIRDRDSFNQGLTELKRRKSQDVKDGGYYSESELEGKTVSSFSSGGQNFNLVVDGEEVVIVDKVDYLKRLLTKDVTLILMDRDFEDQSHDILSNVFYLESEKGLGEGNDKFFDSLNKVTEVKTSPDITQEMDYRKIKSIFLSWDKSNLKGSIRVK